jgi:hypothetical protein
MWNEALPGAPSKLAQGWQHTATSNTLTLLLKTEAAMPKHAGSAPAALTGATILHLLLVPPQQLLLLGGPHAGGAVHLLEQLANDMLFAQPAGGPPRSCTHRGNELKARSAPPHPTEISCLSRLVWFRTCPELLG